MGWIFQRIDGDVLCASGEISTGFVVSSEGNGEYVACVRHEDAPEMKLILGLGWARFRLSLRAIEVEASALQKRGVIELDAEFDVRYVGF